jgi:hypothetical protein
MASGILGQSTLNPTTDTTVYTVPSDTLAIANVNVVNRSNSTSASVRIAIASTATPSDSEWIEYDVNVPPNGVVERSGLAINASKQVIVYASTANCSVSVYGLEQTV